MRDLLSFGRGASTSYERDRSIDRIFTDVARARPNACAIAGSDRSVTYGDAELVSNRIANALLSRGVEPGAAVGVSFERSVSLPLVLLGILKAGAAYVPLDPSFPQERLRFMIGDAAVSIVVTGEQNGHSGMPVDSVSLTDLLQCTDDNRPNTAAAPSSLAYVTYTSGSTGRPKGVAVEHRGVVRLVRGTDYVNVGADETFLHFAPLGFDASTFELWAPLLNGALLAVPEPGLMTMQELAETFDRFGVTTMFLTTALFQRFVDTPSARPETLRTLLTGGEIASPRHLARFLQAFPGCRLVAVYGPTENTTFSTWCDISPSDTLASSVPIGKPIANSSAYVLDDALAPLPVGVEGELYLGGDGVARGYMNRPELTAERFVADPFVDDIAARLYRTGDRARWRSDGLLEFLGRNDDQVKVRGYRIELGEIETALQTFDGIGDAAVVVAERENEKELVAYVVPRSGHVIEERELRVWLSRTLPSFMIPHRIAVRRELPLTPSGKVDRVALKTSEALTAGSAPVSLGAIVPKFNEAERLIAKLWCDVLGRDAAPGLDENFFDVGGDSLRLLAMHARLRAELNAEVNVTDLFEQCTIRKLAVFVRRPAVRA